MVDNQKIRIRLKAFDHRLLDRSVKEIVDTPGRTGQASGGYTAAYADQQVLRSPHVDKKSREQFGSGHKRLMDIWITPDTVDAL